MTALTSPWLWYAARSAGLVAWALLAGSTLVGLLISTRVLPIRPGMAWAVDLHRGLAALAVAFVAVHVGAIFVDGYVPFSIGAVLVPLRSRWHPLWIAWGIVGLWLLVAVEVTSLARRWLPARVWRRTHTLSVPLFAAASVHALAAGTDTGRAIVLVPAVVCVMAIAFLATARGVAVPAPSQRDNG